jgi:hypothetical protein
MNMYSRIKWEGFPDSIYLRILIIFVSTLSALSFREYDRRVTYLVKFGCFFLKGVESIQLIVCHLLGESNCEEVGLSQNRSDRKPRLGITAKWGLRRSQRFSR